MSTTPDKEITMTSTTELNRLAQETTGEHGEVVLRTTESAANRRSRITTGILITVLGLLLLGLSLTAKGSARFALSDAFDAVQLPTFSLPWCAVRWPPWPGWAICPDDCMDACPRSPGPSPGWP